jgi:hypothetical protein
MGTLTVPSSWFHNRTSTKSSVPSRRMLPCTTCLSSQCEQSYLIVKLAITNRRHLTL